MLSSYLKHLKYLNLRENEISDLQIFAHDNIEAVSTHLETFSIQGNPLMEEKADEFKRELLILVGQHFRNLVKLNKEEVVKEDFEEAIAEKEERRKAAELAKQEAEEAAEAERKEKE
jgi:Leucine-rich repeat (LRR) protein